MKFPAKLPIGSECPECGCRERRFPPSRGGTHHVFCDQCGYDFGRFDRMSRHYERILTDLERRLGIDTAPH